MEAWNVAFLGICHARRGEREVPLRSKKARTVLASLLLPARLSFPLSTIPAVHSRQTLAERFWGDKTDPRVHLRQSLSALTALFGDECFYADQDALRAVPGAFVTDIDRIWAAYQRGLAATSLDERLHHLIEAEGEMNGPFLEGCFRPGDEGEPWLLSRRAEVHSGIGVVLFALAEAFEQAGNLNGAMEAARRAVRFLPESAPAQTLVWRLAGLTGQEAALPRLEAATFEQAAAQIAERGGGRAGGAAHLTGAETRLFDGLYKAKLAALPPPVQKALPRLTVLPAPFSPEIALQVCRVSRRTLLTLARAALLERTKETFALSDAVRACALRQVSSPARQQMAQKLARICETWAYAATACAPDKAFPPPFESVAQAEPFLAAVLRWNGTQPASFSCVDFVSRLHSLGFLSLAYEAIPFLDAVCADEAHPPPLRYLAGSTAGNLLFNQSAFSDAVLRFERALSFPAPSSSAQDALQIEGGIYFGLGNAIHHAGNSPAALVHLRHAQSLFEQAGMVRDMTDCLRVRAEILNHLGDYEEALAACDQSLAVRRTLPNQGHSIADALFWKGATLLRLQRSAEAAECIEEALALWQEAGDLTGMGFCLRLMGRLRAAQGRFAEAGAHIDHAILLHERASCAGSRRAAVEARADIFFQQGRMEKALPLYEECLAGHEAQQQEKAVLRLRERIQSCQEATY